MAIFKETTKTDGKSQADEFDELVRELGSDEDETRWEDRMRKVTMAKPDSEKP